MGADAVTALVGVLVPLLAAGAAYGGVRAGLHGCRQSLDDMSRVVERLDARLQLRHLRRELRDGRQLRLRG